MTKNVFLDEWWEVRKPTGTAAEVEIRVGVGGGGGGGGGDVQGAENLKMRSVRERRPWCNNSVIIGIDCTQLFSQSPPLSSPPPVPSPAPPPSPPFSLSLSLSLPLPHSLSLSLCLYL